MTDHLVKRLRAHAHWGMTEEAADRIEALTAERDEAINQLDSAIHSQIVLEKRTAAVMEDRKLILEERDRTFVLMLTRAEKAEAEVLALREVIGAVNNEFGSAAWDWPDPWRRIAQLKELSNDRWKRAEAAEADNARLREALAMIDAIDPEYRIDGCAQSVVRGLVLRMGEMARAALNTGKEVGHE